MQLQLATSILTEMREVKKRYEKFAVVARQLDPIAGDLRGLHIGDLVVEITAQNFYSKTFIIEHSSQE
jgi:hypothetical protein